MAKRTLSDVIMPAYHGWEEGVVQSDAEVHKQFNIVNQYQRKQGTG